MTVVLSSNRQSLLRLLSLEIERSVTEKADLENAIEVLIRDRERNEEELVSQQEGHSSILEELKVIDNRLKESRDQYNLTQKTFSEKKLSQERLRISIDGIVAQASENQHLDISQYQFTPDAEFDNTAQTRKMSRLKSSVEQLGAINMMALGTSEALRCP